MAFELPPPEAAWTDENGFYLTCEQERPIELLRVPGQSIDQMLGPYEGPAQVSLLAKE